MNYLMERPGSGPANEDGRRSWTFAVLVALLFVGLAWIVAERNVFDVERRAQALIQFERHPLLEGPMEVLSGLGSGWVTVPLGLAASWWLWERHRGAALLLLCATSAGVVVSSLVKWAVSRPRPNVDPNGFPSGHVMTTVATLGALLYLMRALGAPRRWRVLATVACCLAVGAVGYSRLYLNAHWITDVVGGLLGGTACVALGVVLTAKLPRHSDGGRF